MAKYLLDTHTLLWLLFSDERLSTKVKNILLNSELEKSVSVISLWEISLKYRIGKLKLEEKTPDEIPPVIERFGYKMLVLGVRESSTFYKISKVKNKDPFDLILAWQAINEKFVLLSKDKGFDDFKTQGLKRFW